ncbi:MAG: class I SAM-dependent methyltransferase [Chloroflexi bacterium]|nr:class I SAM-dependent methyltransferase [Chloroflexota bacterium]
MNTDAVRTYYAGIGEREWARLENPEDGAIEFEVTCQVLAKYLLPHARVLDIGGGPGRYTIWLAQRGHHVTLADLCPEQLSIARTKIGQAGAEAMVEEVVVADARELSHWADNSFDAVLSLGPFYHLPDPNDRNRAAAELPAFFALMALRLWR